MRVAIDVSPLHTDRFTQNKVRGTGFYIENLEKSLIKYFPGNEYIFYTRGQKLPKDIDLYHFPYFEPFFLTLPLFNMHKFVVTVHDLTPLVFPRNFPVGFKGKVKWNIQRTSLLKAAQVITDSYSSKRDIEKIAALEENRINVIYLAADSDFKKEKISKDEASELMEKYNLPEKFALYVGDVTWNKNLPNLIRAVNKAQIKLVMIGKALVQKDYDTDNLWNSDLNEVYKLSESNENIIKLGFIEKKDLVKIYNLATVFVMPSIYEGFGLPVLEAASCGCPVITTKGGSLSEVMGDAAIYVDPQDINDIADKLEKVFKDMKLQETLSKKGLEQSNNFTWKKTAQETVEVYEKVLNA